ncbi:MAG TPA: oligosaccharide flippase family protein [Blastocatellia bacterium]|nr:oligosaccharide flippase family protein [Blastocatellia bacterium]
MIKMTDNLDIDQSCDAQGRLQSGSSLSTRAAWILFAKVVAFALTFFLPLLLVRRLSQHEFGLYKQVFLVVGTAITMLPLGFGMSAYYFLPRERERQSHIVLNILLFYIFVAGAACLALLLSPSLLEAIFNSSELVRYAPLIGAVIVLWVLSSFLDIVAVANQEPKLASLFIIASQATKSFLLLGAAVAFGTVRALIYAAIIQGIVQLLILFFYLRSRFAHFWRSFNLTVMREQLSYALPLGFAGLLYSMQMDVHNYFVSNRFGPAAYAVYAIGCFQLPLVGILSEAVCSVMIPRVSYLQKHGRNREIVLLSARVMRKLSLVYFPLHAFLIVAGREFITFLFTSQYQASWPIFAVNITMIPFGIIVLDPIMRAYAEQRYFLLRVRMFLIGALLIALWFGTERFGLVGTISIVVATALVERAVTAIKMWRVIGVTRRDIALLKDVGKVAVATIAAAAIAAIIRSSILYTTPFIVLIVSGVAFSLAYLASLLLLGVMTQEERSVIRQKLARLRWSPKRAATPLAEGDY